ncbi:beta-galactosidase 13-like [Silene latifolia]|uniref:beta-galactosidase 13-like n=1 Tax=Silene latifolia TaxID=37657 RepID=UPI003D77915D
MSRYGKCMLTLALVLFLTAHAEEKNGKQLGVTYDSRSLLINGRREFLYSGSVHYPRLPMEMWGDILDKCKEGGLNVIQTYVFWGLHEPVKGQYNFTGRYDVVKFFKMIAERGMWATIRVGPFVQAEWNNGGYPFWLRKEPNIIYRTDNEVFKAHTKRWVTTVISLMKENKLFASQGGPIILSQIENEYDHVRGAFRDGAAERYIKWAGNMAVAQETGVPWIMCKQKDAPGPVINACNGRHCGETFDGPNAPNKPSLWTENWTTQFKSFGEIASQRSAEDTAYGVARWFSKNGSHTNYYMYYGGTNFARTASDFATTGYYDEAPIDHFGLLREPKFGHLKDLHRALTLSKKAMLAGRYKIEVFGPEFEARFYEKDNLCAAFIWNNRSHVTLKANFKGKEHAIPPKSISILPDCKTVVYNTNYMLSQHNAREFVRSEKANKGLNWVKTSESLPTKGHVFTRSPLEQFTTTEDTTDYLWYSTSIDLDNVDLPFKKSTKPVLQLRCLGDALLAFVNGEFVGTGHGYHRSPTFPFQAPVKLKEGVNNITILTTTVGMPDSGSYMEKRMAGLRFLELQGLGSGDLDLSYNGWHHKVGLEGEKLKYFTEEGANKAKWTSAKASGKPLTWYKTYFDEPEGQDPVAIRVANMTKGMIWINGESIGRYWSTFLTLRQTPSQSEYHIPRSYLKPKDNFLVIFDEAGGNIDTVQIETVNRDTICGIVGEDMPASVYSWKRDDRDILSVVDDTQPKVSLKCPKDKVISHVDFASFGNPYGVCGYFLLGNCTSPISQKIVEEHCLGKDSCRVPVSRNLFDKDQKLCPELPKTLAVQVRCTKKH